MPHFSAIYLDRFLEPGSRNPRPKPPLAPAPAPVKLGSDLSYSEKNNIPHRPPHVVSPILYATPDVTPLLDSPSSFPPSPYIVNHKRRGPRLFKSFSQSSVNGGDNLQPFNLDLKVEVTSVAPRNKEPEVVENGSGNENCLNDSLNNGVIVKKENGKSVDVEEERSEELDDFCDFLDSMSSVSNTEVDDIALGERPWKPGTPAGEFYDAFDEVSSDGATRLSCRNIEDELREMRLNLLTEIERRKQTEEALENFHGYWRSLRHHLALVGLALPALPDIRDNTAVQLNLNPAELYQQVLIARYVADSVGRGSSWAEVEMEMEPQILAKNFEIARLSDRLQYYEAANREMSQRNQEAVEMARQQRHKRKRRQRWFWSSIGFAVTLGTAAIAWYIPASKSSPHEGEALTSHSD